MMKSYPEKFSTQMQFIKFTFISNAYMVFMTLAGFTLARYTIESLIDAMINKAVNSLIYVASWKSHQLHIQIHNYVKFQYHLTYHCKIHHEF